MDVAQIIKVLRAWFRGTLEEGKPLANFTTFHIGGPAALLAIPKGLEDMKLIAREVASSQIPMLVLGRGSNVLVSDKGFPGVVLVLGEGLSRIKKQGDCQVNVEAGCEMNRLVSWAIENRLGGLESLAGIPGAVGGSVRMNAGAQGGCIGDRVKEVSVLRIESGEIKDRDISSEQMGFGYRSTRIEDNEIIHKVKLYLTNIKDKERLEERRKEVLKWRKDNQPLNRPSAGSVFRNPAEISAAELIDRCGLKGKSVGGAMVSLKHANFIVNEGEATARDVCNLINLVKEEVMRREGIELQEEIKLIGDMGGTS
jgi:UDP-N-acetylmuramate dehydrogenase